MVEQRTRDGEAAEQKAKSPDGEEQSAEGTRTQLSPDLRLLMEVIKGVLVAREAGTHAKH